MSITAEGIQALPTARQRVKAAATLMNVSERAVWLAGKVVAHGIPELQPAIAQDRISVSDAAAIVHEPPERQREALAAVLAGQARTLRAVLGRKGPSAYDRLVKAWNACSDDERERFAAELQRVDC